MKLFTVLVACIVWCVSVPAWADKHLRIALFAFPPPKVDRLTLVYVWGNRLAACRHYNRVGLTSLSLYSADDRDAIAAFGGTLIESLYSGVATIMFLSVKEGPLQNKKVRQPSTMPSIKRLSLNS